MDAYFKKETFMGKNSIFATPMSRVVDCPLLPGRSHRAWILDWVVGWEK
jgi:hypothetical protein